jgi:hypothetical protein
MPLKYAHNVPHINKRGNYYYKNSKRTYNSKSIWNPPSKNVSWCKRMYIVKLFMKSKAPNKQVFLTEKTCKTLTN